LCQGTNSYV
ncbi:hypothetical protein TIFTF001_006456, partial [Ficus carica]